MNEKNQYEIPVAAVICLPTDNIMLESEEKASVEGEIIVPGVKKL